MWENIYNKKRKSFFDENYSKKIKLNKKRKNFFDEIQINKKQKLSKKESFFNIKNDIIDDNEHDSSSKAQLNIIYCLLTLINKFYLDVPHVSLVGGISVI